MKGRIEDKIKFEKKLQEKLIGNANKYTWV